MQDPGTESTVEVRFPQEQFSMLCDRHPDLFKLAERAKHIGFDLMTSPKGDEFFVMVGPMRYLISSANERDVHWRRTEDQIHACMKLLNGCHDLHVVVGWCVGHRLHNQQGKLAAVLEAHLQVIKACSCGMRLTVHTAAHTARWNSDIIMRHFEDFRLPRWPEQEVIKKEVLRAESDKRATEAEMFRIQCDDRVEFDTLINETGGPIHTPSGNSLKEIHIATASREICSLVEHLRDSDQPPCKKFREILYQRGRLLRDHIQAKITNKSAKNARNALKLNQEWLVTTAFEAFELNGPTTQRRAELALHSMDILEQTAIIALNPLIFPKGGGKNRETRDESLRALFSSPDEGDVTEFQRRLLSAICDDKATTYMTAQEYEFMEASRHRHILYIYSRDPGPFIMREARPRITTLIGEPKDSDGSPLFIYPA